MKKIITTCIICLILIVCALYIKSIGGIGVIGDKLSGYIVENVDISSVKVNDLQIAVNTHYYDFLSNDQKKIYGRIAKGVRDLSSDITVYTKFGSEVPDVSADIGEVVDAFLMDHPEVFYVESTYEIPVYKFVIFNMVKVKFNYSVDTKDDLNTKLSLMSEAVDKIISGNVKDDMNDFEKALALHDYLAKNVKYYDYKDINKIPSSKHNINGAFLEKEAVCDGFTKAYQILLDKVGIQSIMIDGKNDNVAHAWNVVKIDNGYYHTDVTADKGLMDAGEKYVVHSYFNITANEIKETHEIKRPDKIPACTDTKHNYYKYTSAQITGSDNFEAKLQQIISKQSSKNLLEVKITGMSKVEQKLIDTLYNLNFNGYRSRGTTSISYHKILNTYIFIK